MGNCSASDKAYLSLLRENLRQLDRTNAVVQALIVSGERPNRVDMAYFDENMRYFNEHMIDIKNKVETLLATDCISNKNDIDSMKEIWRLFEEGMRTLEANMLIVRNL
jgi:2-iminoacetate synthase ThiH